MGDKEYETKYKMEMYDCFFRQLGAGIARDMRRRVYNYMSMD